jgi:hypothetical protein
MNWIDVRNKLPEKNGIYIVFYDTYRRWDYTLCNMNGEDASIIMAFFSVETSKNKSEWESCAYGDLDIKIYPTHWMRLPEKPKA